MLVGSSGPTLISLQYSKWSTPSPGKLYPLMGRPGSTGLVGV